MSRVNVNFAKRSYEIRIEPLLLEKAGSILKAQFPNARFALVSDETVFKLHGQRLLKSLQDEKIIPTTLLVPAGESSKSFSQLEIVLNGLLEAKLERGDVVIAFGGGVVGDLTGFAASILRRGMLFVQMPTTLLSQVDSSVGGKTGINTKFGKNLVGAFYQPSLVLADLTLLSTLPARDFASGYAEVVKYGLINNVDFFNWCETNLKSLLDHSSNSLSARDYAVTHSCNAKAQIVERDETETGERALLNLGHTFGHALEALTKYDSSRLLHGEAIAIGMTLAFRYSAQENLCSHDEAERVEAHFRKANLPTRLNEVKGGLGSLDEIMEAISQDKKVSRGTLTFILVNGIGKSFIAKDVSRAKIETFLKVEMDRSR